MAGERIADAALIGFRGRVAERVARWVAQRTPFDERTLVTLVGVYLFASRARRTAQMLARLRRDLTR